MLYFIKYKYMYKILTMQFFWIAAMYVVWSDLIEFYETL